MPEPYKGLLGEYCPECCQQSLPSVEVSVMFPRVEGKPLTWSTSSRKAAFALGDVSQSSPGNLSARLYQVFFFPLLLLKCIVHTLPSVFMG